MAKNGSDQETFASFIQRDRERLNKEREEIFTQQQDLEQRLGTINAELKAIDAYEAVKQGRALPTEQSRQQRAPRQQTSGARRPRGEIRTQLLDLIKENPDGLSRGEILERLGGKGNKAMEHSVSNALNNMKKANPPQVGHREDGKYTAP